MNIRFIIVTIVFIAGVGVECGAMDAPDGHPRERQQNADSDRRLSVAPVPDQPTSPRHLTNGWFELPRDLVLLIASYVAGNGWNTWSAGSRLWRMMLVNRHFAAILRERIPALPYEIRMDRDGDYEVSSRQND